MVIHLSPRHFFCLENACLCTFSLSMASSPPGVDMMRSWMLETDWSPAWLHREPEDGEAVRQPIGAVEKWPGRWFSEASKYLCLLLCISFRSEPQWRDRRRKEEEAKVVETEMWQSTGDRKKERKEGRKRTKRRKDQCKTHSSRQRITTNTPVRESDTVFTSGPSI